VSRTYIKQAREVGMSQEQVGEALSVAKLARATARGLAEAAFEYAAKRSAYLKAARRVPLDLRRLRRLISDRGPPDSHPAADEQGHPEGCQRLAFQFVEWLSHGD
jgi:hypothetical protein